MGSRSKFAGKPHKSDIVAALIEAHEHERRICIDFVSDHEGQETFESAMNGMRAKVARIDSCIANFRQMPRGTLAVVDVGAALVVDNSERGREHYAVVKATEIAAVPVGPHQVRIATREQFAGMKPGSVKKYRTGRPGEQFEVTDTLVEIY